MCIVAEHASVKFGGEAILPYQYFSRLRARGVEAWLVVHERTKSELSSLLPGETGRMRFIADTWLHKLLWKVGRPLPSAVRFATTGFALRVLSQVCARRAVKRLVKEERITVVHEPIPVSPRNPSLMHGVGAPVVIGPMNGGMSYPPAFAWMASGFERRFVAVGRAMAGVMNRVIPGKRRAALLLVANERSRSALPSGVGARDRVEVFVENGVDLGLWKGRTERNEAGPLTFLFLGRLIPLKAVDMLLEAFVPIAREYDAVLEILGDGPERPGLEAKAGELGLRERVNFAGFVAQTTAAERMARADVFVLPSLHECGGAVVLEAMACGVPAIVADWGGPADYVDDTCGILVKPEGRAEFVKGLTEAMTRLAQSPELRRSLGEGGKERIRSAGFDWETKIDAIVALYRRVGGEAVVASGGGGS